MALLNDDSISRVWFDRHSHDWVESGLITPDQAEAIRHFEHIDQPEAPQRLTLLTETGAYIGSVLALMGGAAVVGPNWNDLALLGQLAVAAAVTIVGFLAGTWLIRLGESATERLGAFLWVVGTGGTGMLSAAVMGQIDPHDGAWFALTIGLSVLFTGLALWRNLDRPLQLLSAGIGVGITWGGVVGLTNAPAWVVGVVPMMLGIGFAALAAVHLLVPRLLALGVGSVGAYIGALRLMEVNEHLGTALALGVALSVVVLALRERLTPLLVLGVVGSLLATQALLLSTFTGPIASTIVALLGVAIVVLAITRTRRSPPTQ